MSGASNKPSGVRCPICVTWYSKLLRKAGQKCGDHSQKQKRPCVGLVMDEADFQRAEWIRPVESTAPYVSPLREWKEPG